MENKLCLECNVNGYRVLIVKAANKENQLSSFYYGKQEFESNKNAKALYYIIFAQKSGVRNISLKQDDIVINLNRISHIYRTINSPVYTFLITEDENYGTLIFTDSENIPLFEINFENYKDEL